MIEDIDQLRPATGLASSLDKGLSSRKFSPYVDNGGSILAIAGDDFAVCVADSRISTGYRIHKRDGCKITQLTEFLVVASVGMLADIMALHKVLKHDITLYNFKHRTAPSPNAVAQMLSTILYRKRFFPYYTFNVLVGLDSKGAVYTYDAIGSMTRVPHSAAGSGREMGIATLDNQLTNENKSIANPKLTKLQTIELAKDVMISIAERDILTGDSAHVMVVDVSGIHLSSFPLRRD